MKKITLVIAFIAMSFVGANAQTDKGTLLLGGGLGFSSEKEGESSSSTLSISPNIGYFLKDNLAIGANIGFTSFGGDAKGSEMQIGPLVRYYAFELGEKAKVFAQASYGFGSSKEGDEEAVGTSSWGISVGPAFFLNESVALETTLNYGSTTVNVDGAEPTSNFGLNVGFQIHFHK